MDVAETIAEEYSRVALFFIQIFSRMRIPLILRSPTNSVKDSFVDYLWITIRNSCTFSSVSIQGVKSRYHPHTIPRSILPLSSCQRPYTCPRVRLRKELVRHDGPARVIRSELTQSLFILGSLDPRLEPISCCQGFQNHNAHLELLSVAVAEPHF